MLGEDLDARVFAIADIDVRTFVDGDAVRQVEFAIVAALFSPGIQQLAVGGEVVNPGIAVAIGGIEGSVRGESDVGDPVERAGGAHDGGFVEFVTGVGRRAAADFSEVGAIESVFVDAVVLIIDEVEFIVGGHVTAMRADELAFTPGVEEFAVLVEDDDGMFATAENIDPVVGIDGDAGDFGETPAFGQLLPVFDHVVFEIVPSVCHLLFLWRWRLGFVLLLRRLADPIGMFEQVDQLTVTFFAKLGDAASARLLVTAFDQHPGDVFCQLGFAEVVPNRFVGLAQMFDKVAHAAITAGEVEGHVRSHQRPAKAGSVGNRSVDILDTGDAGFEGMDGLAPKGDLQAIDQMARRFAVQPDRPFADGLIEGDGLIDGRVRCLLATDDFDQWDQMRWVERVADHQPCGEGLAFLEFRRRDERGRGSEDGFGANGGGYGGIEVAFDLDTLRRTLLDEGGACDGFLRFCVTGQPARCVGHQVEALQDRFGLLVNRLEVCGEIGRRVPGGDVEAAGEKIGGPTCANRAGAEHGDRRAQVILHLPSPCCRRFMSRRAVRWPSPSGQGVWPRRRGDFPPVCHQRQPHLYPRPGRPQRQR